MSTLWWYSSRVINRISFKRRAEWILTDKLTPLKRRPLRWRHRTFHHPRKASSRLTVFAAPDTYRSAGCPRAVAVFRISCKRKVPHARSPVHSAAGFGGAPLLLRVRSWFLFTAEQYSIVGFIRSPIRRRLCCFRVSAAVNLCAQIRVWHTLSFLSSKYLGVKRVGGSGVRLTCRESAELAS